MKALKFSLMALAISAATGPAFAQSADEIIAKHITAIGGEKNWAKVKTVKMTGSAAAQGMEVTMVKTVVNGKASRTDINAMGQKGYMIFGTAGGWSFLPFMGQTEPAEIPLDAMKFAVDEYDYKSNQLADKALIASATLDGTDTVDSKACTKLKVTDKLGNVRECYIDNKTYYLVKTEQSLKMQGQEQEVTMTYSGHKKLAEGIVVPMTVGQQMGDVTYKSIEINKPVDEKIFKPDTK